MTQISLSAPQYFRAGQGGVSAVVGVESTLNRVARYSFVAPGTGASAFSFGISGLVFGEGTRPQSLGLFLGTDPESHKNAGAGSQTTAVLSPNADYTAYQAAAQLLLLPGQRYYLFLFPLTATYGWYTLELAQAGLELSGGSASTPSLSAATLDLGKALTIQTNRHSDRFTHRLTYQFAGLTGQIADGVGASCSWTPPLSLAEAIPSGLRGSCTITCTTYEGSQVIGSTSVSLVLTVPERVVPTVKLTLGTGPWVQNVSRLEPAVEAQGAYGSTITAQSLRLGGQSYTGGVVKKAGENQLTVTVTDSRGRSAQASLTFQVVAYEPPELSLGAHRCDSDGTPNDSGEFCQVTLSGSLWAQEATLTTGWGESLQLEKGDFNHSVILPAPSEQSLSLWAALTDQYLTTRRELTLSVGYATVDFLAGGRGIAFGTTAQQEGFVCAMDAQFLGSVGGVIADYVVAQGTAGTWSWRKWNSGVAECWGRHTLAHQVSVTDSWGHLYCSGEEYFTYPQGLFAHRPEHCSMELTATAGKDFWLARRGMGDAQRTDTVFLITATGGQVLPANAIAISAHALGRWK